MLSIGLRAIRWRTVPLVHAAPLVAATRMLATRPKSKPMTKPQPKQAAMGPQTGEDASMLKLASLRLICDQGKVLGVMPPQQAHDEAAARGLFLLEVQGSTDPPVWRLVATLPSRAAAEDKPGGEPAPSRGVPGRQGRGSVGQQPTKRPTNKEARIKEVRLVDKSADHDVDTKMNFARGQLEKGRIVQECTYIYKCMACTRRTHGMHARCVCMACTRYVPCASRTIPGVHPGHGPSRAGLDHLARGDHHGAPR